MGEKLLSSLSTNGYHEATLLQVITGWMEENEQIKYYNSRMLAEVQVMRDDLTRTVHQQRQAQQPSAGIGLITERFPDLTDVNLDKARDQDLIDPITQSLYNDPIKITVQDSNGNSKEFTYDKESLVGLGAIDNELTIKNTEFTDPTTNSKFSILKVEPDTQKAQQLEEFVAEHSSATPRR